MNRAQRGVAVVMALGVVALAAVATAAMLSTQSVWSRQMELEDNHAQAQMLVQSGVDWARAVLADDRRRSNVDHLKEPWALRLPPMPVDNGELAGYIEDQHGKFNLNNLVTGGRVNPAQLEKFRRLLGVLGLPPDLGDALADWLDADAQPLAAGAEDDHYLSLDPAYFAANRPLADLGELASVRGFNGEVLARLTPFVTALPVNTALNANTAPPEILAAVIEGLGFDGGRSLVAQRERAPFRDYADFAAHLPSGVHAVEGDFRTNSSYFLAHVRVTIGGAEARGRALLVRSDVGWPAIAWRKYE